MAVAQSRRGPDATRTCVLAPVWRLTNTKEDSWRTIRGFVLIRLASTGQRLSPSRGGRLAEREAGE